MPRHRVKAMFHATAMVRDYSRTVQRMAQLFGLRVLEYGESTDPAIGRRGGMTWVGDGSIEIGQPTVNGAPPDRFVQRTGGGMQGVAVLVDDFESTAEHLAARGVAMPVRLGHFGFTSPRATAGLQFEWSDFTVDEDPRIGSAVPPFLVEPVIRVTQLAFVGAVADVPSDAASLLAEILDTRVTFLDPSARIGSPVGGIDLGDCSLALYQNPYDASQALWGRPRDRPGVSVLGLRVDDVDEARSALADAAVRVVRDEPGQLVLDPRNTGDIEVVIVDHLLEGDPRRSVAT